MLQIAFLATDLLVLTSNTWLLQKLMLKKVKSRPDKLFIIICLSDMGKGAFTVPLLSLMTFPLNDSIICFLYKGLNFFCLLSVYFFMHYRDHNCNRQMFNDYKIQNLWKIYYN